MEEINHNPSLRQQSYSYDSSNSNNTNTNSSGNSNDSRGSKELLDSPVRYNADHRKSIWATVKYNIIPNSGDINALFSVFLDNLANITSMVGILVYSFGMPIDLIGKYFIPGCSLSIMLGSLALSIYAMYLDYHEKDPSVLYTSIPIGLDAPSTVGISLLVVGPAFVSAKEQGLSDFDATMQAWTMGCCTIFLIGIVKLLLSFASYAQNQFHPVGKAGAIGSIGFALLGLNQLTAILVEPVAGWVSVWILLIILIQRVNKNGKVFSITLPFNISGVLISLLAGSVIYYFMAGVKLSVVPMPEGLVDNYELSFPHPVNIFKVFVSSIKQNISIAIPYAILVNIGGLTVTDQAINEGNAYNTRAILLLDSGVTIISSLFGAPTQTTPYLGHTIFHSKFKAKSGYSIVTALIIGLGGFFGYITFLSKILPKPAIFPIFIYIAMEICADTFYNTKGIKPFHAPAIMWTFFPAIFQYVNIILDSVSPVLASSVIDPALVVTKLSLTLETVNNIGVIKTLAHGFICTSLFWGSAMAFFIENNLKKSAIFLGCCAFLTFFGIIHSVSPAGEVYLPWKSGSSIPYHWTIGYILIALITFAFSFYKPKSKININHNNDKLDDHHETSPKIEKITSINNNDNDNETPEMINITPDIK